ncbi:hypothetical protein BDN72DRAFT_962395 [Pluteus cervinus]|uniref:Uncharacterized protein n=1 Tax=Pluteus cervinus TaxID=181527 RepID=A0ACD3AI97_9AGAR|nr:hypothetical protein BDN72DRAFT_962395 [Pluteus cervinus]
MADTSYTTASVIHWGGTAGGAMQEALNTKRIIENIFGILSPDVSRFEEAVLEDSTEDPMYRSPAERATLFSSALTCRAFREPALNRLWKTMDSPLPFASLLFSSSSDSNFDFVTSSPLPMAIRKNLNRIKTFIYNVPEEKFIQHIDVFLAITALQPVLLPNLRTLIIPNFQRCLSVSTFHFSLISPSISTIDIGGIESEEGYMLFMSALCYRAQDSMKEIYCRSDNLPNAALSLPRLQSLHLQKLSPTIDLLIGHLATLSNLRRIDLTLAPFKLDTKASAINFAHLEDVRLSGMLQDIAQFLNKCQTPRLQSLALYVQPVSQGPRRSYVGDMLTVMAVISRHTKWRQTLTTLRITPVICSDYAQFFRSLSDYPLATLYLDSHISLPQSIRLSLADIAKHLPNIRILYLPPYRPGDEPTISQLSELARLRPKLRELGTSLRLKSSGSSEIPRMQHNLERLHVYHSSVTDNWDIPDQLDSLFPYLGRIETSPDNDFARHWKQIEALLKLCQRARRRL